MHSVAGRVLRLLEADGVHSPVYLKCVKNAAMRMDPEDIHCLNYENGGFGHWTENGNRPERNADNTRGMILQDHLLINL